MSLLGSKPGPVVKKQKTLEAFWIRSDKAPGCPIDLTEHAKGSPNAARPSVLSVPFSSSSSSSSTSHGASSTCRETILARPLDYGNDEDSGSSSSNDEDEEYAFEEVIKKPL